MTKVLNFEYEIGKRTVEVPRLALPRHSHVALLNVEEDRLFYWEEDQAPKRWGWQGASRTMVTGN